jgi:prepilin-type N-terminal cleavage/methylation domain-containing protein
MGSPRLDARRAFTLIEMLVVITIMALLVALLMPVLGSAKEAAHRAMCASNLRQWGIFANNYAESNRDWYPGGTHWGSNEIFSDVNNGTDTVPNWEGTQYKMVDYGFNIPVTRCPSRKQDRWSWYDNFPSGNPPSSEGWFATDYWHFFGRSSRAQNDGTNFQGTGWTVGPLYADWNFGWKTRAPIPNRKWPRSLRAVMAMDRSWANSTVALGNDGEYYYDQTGFDLESNHRVGTGVGAPVVRAAGSNYLLMDASVTWDKLDDGNVWRYGLRNGLGPGMQDYYRHFPVGTKLRHP